MAQELENKLDLNLRSTACMRAFAYPSTPTFEVALGPLLHMICSVRQMLGTRCSDGNCDHFRVEQVSTGVRKEQTANARVSQRTRVVESGMMSACPTMGNGEQ